MKQTKDYNCGVFAAIRLMQGCTTLNYSPSKLERIARSTKEGGTTHAGMIRMVKSAGLSCKSGKSTISNLLRILRGSNPCIVNVQWNGDGHYMVAEGTGHGFILLYDPESGKVVVYPLRKFREIWYSKRYGKQWMLYSPRVSAI